MGNYSRALNEMYKNHLMSSFIWKDFYCCKRNEIEFNFKQCIVLFL